MKQKKKPSVFRCNLLPKLWQFICPNRDVFTAFSEFASLYLKYSRKRKEKKCDLSSFVSKWIRTFEHYQEFLSKQSVLNGNTIPAVLDCATISDVQPTRAHFAIILQVTYLYRILLASNSDWGTCISEWTNW